MAKRTVWVVEGYSESYLDVESEVWIEGIGNCREAALEIIRNCIKNQIKNEPENSVFNEVPTIEQIEEHLSFSNDIRFRSFYWDSFLSIFEIPVQYKKRRK